MNKGAHSENKKGCAEHLFCMSPLRPNCYFQKVITAQFCQNTDRNANKIQSKIKKRNSKKKLQKQPCLELNLPSFNTDKNYGSPGFALSSEKVYYRENFVRIQFEHQRHVHNIERNNVQICIPKPGSKNNFCSVCKQQYEQYISHINSENHKKRIRANKFNDYILDQQKQMIKHNPFNSKIGYESTLNSNSEKPSGHLLYMTTAAEQNIQHQYNNGLYEKTEEKRLIGNPRKMVKVNPYFMPICPNLAIKKTQSNYQGFVAWQNNYQNQCQKMDVSNSINFNKPHKMIPPYINYNFNVNPMSFTKKSSKIQFHANQSQNFIPCITQRHQNQNQNSQNKLYQINEANRHVQFNQCFQNIAPPPSFYPLIPSQLSYFPYNNYNNQSLNAFVEPPPSIQTNFNLNYQNYDPNGYQQRNINQNSLPINYLIDPFINWNAHIQMHQMLSAFHIIQNMQEMQRIQMQANNGFSRNTNDPNYPMCHFNMSIISEESKAERSQEKREKNNSCQKEKQDIFGKGCHKVQGNFQGNVHKISRNQQKKVKKIQGLQQADNFALSNDMFHFGLEHQKQIERERQIIMEQVYEKCKK